MLSRLANILAGSRQISYPSIVLIIGPHTLHIVPENGVVEIISVYTRPPATTFSYNGATERSRELLNSITLHVGDGENSARFLENVSTQAIRILSKCENPSPGADAVHAVEQALRSAVLENLRDKAERKPSMNATQQYSIFVVQINRSRPGRIVTEAVPTSFPH